MSSLSIPLPRQISDNQFVGDLMTLLRRRKVKCGDPQIFDNFASELVSNSALRSDLFTLCMAISHMAAEDLSGEELLVLVMRALGGPGAAKGVAVDEIPAGMRSAFLDGYEAWSKRAASAIDKPLARPPLEICAPGDEPPPAVESESAVVAEDSAMGERSIQMALNIVRERSANGVTAFPLSGAGARFEDDATFAPVNRPNNWFARGGVSVRISASAILTLAGLFVIATGLGGAYVYHSLHPATVQRPAEVKPMAKPKAGLSYSSLDLDSQVIHAGPQPAPSSPSEPRATQAVRPKSTRQQVAMAVLAPDQQEALLDSVSEAAASVAASDAAPTQAATSRATAEAHIISPVHVSSTTMNGLALSAPRPVYPADQEKGISGTVVLEVSISKRGNVTDARAVSGPPALRRAAEQAVEEWRFRPYLVDGDPTEVTTTVGFFFNGR